MGDFRQGIEVMRQATALLTGELRTARFGLTTLPAVISRCCLSLGLAEGASVTEDAVRLAEAAALPFSIVTALHGMGVLSRRLGALHTAIPVLERGLRLCQSANVPMFFPLTASALGAAYALAGRRAEALPLLDLVRERVVTGSLILHQALVLTELSEAYLLVGRVEEASALATRLRDLSRTHTGGGYQAHACRLLGEGARHRDAPDVDQAVAHYQQALTLAEQLGMRPLVAHCYRGLGTLYTARGQVEQARAALSAAFEMYRGMAMTFWLPQAEAALAQVEGQ
jgi:tetratricopeptide (TPR) repeat protein